MKITERRLRSIIRNVIKESQEDLRSIENHGDADYLASEFGIYDLEDAVRYASEGSLEESKNNLIARFINESKSEEKKVVHAANSINRQLSNVNDETLSRAGSKLSELKGESNTVTRLEIASAALGILGVSVGASLLFGPVLLMLIGTLSKAPFALSLLKSIGPIGSVISMCLGAVGISASGGSSSYTL